MAGTGAGGRIRWLRSTAVALTGLTLVAGGLSGCQARPGDAPTVEEPGTTAAVPPSPVPEELRTITVGMDSIPADLNPHLIGSRSLATSVVASLTLPSAFTAAPSGDGRRTVLNTDLLQSVSVTGGDDSAPTAVRYVLRPTAQWSDGTPVTGSDFEYLRDRMTTVSGVLDPAGYAAVTAIDVSDGGRTVDVTFRAPNPDWRELFADLLPSHIYRSEDRSFSTMMSTVPAASGGVFRVRAVDTARGVIELERNERYWGETPARIDRLVLSVVADPDTATQMMRTGQLQSVMTSARAVTAESLASVPGARVRTAVRRPDLVLTLNPTAPRMSSAALRSQLTGALDTTLLARILTGDPAATPPARAVTTDESAVSEQSAEPEPSAVVELPGTGSGLSPLRIGAVQSDATAVEAARRIVDQLVDAGIDATVVARPAADFYDVFLPSGQVDAMVAWQEAPETLTELRSRYGCDSTDRTVSRASSPLPEATVGPTAETEPADPTTTTTGKSGDPSTGDSGRTVNVAGICDPEIEAILDEAESASSIGAVDAVRDAIDRVGSLVTRSAIEVPLIHDRFVTAVGPDLEGLDGQPSGWPVDRETGPLISAGRWRRADASGGTTAGTATASESREPGESAEESRK